MMAKKKEDKKYKIKGLPSDEIELTEKQAIFVNAVLQGLPYIDAYIEAYKPVPGTPRNKISSMASRVRNKPQVSKALGEAVLTINTQQIMWTKEKAITKLMGLLSAAEDELKICGLNRTVSDTILGAIKELNVIAGHNWKDKKTHEIQLAKLEIERLNYELNKKAKLEDPKELEELEDDGFMDAIKEGAKGIWEDEE